MRALVSPPVQINADISTTARALFFSLACVASGFVVLACVWRQAFESLPLVCLGRQAFSLECAASGFVFLSCVRRQVVLDRVCGVRSVFSCVCGVRLLFSSRVRGVRLLFLVCVA